MAELLVRTIDKVNKDFYLNLQCTKRGDVIVVCPDDWSWGKEEINSEQYTIIKMPGVAVEEVEHLLAPEPQVDARNPSKTVQRRMWKIDLDNPVVLKGELSLKDVEAAAVQKLSVADPVVIGDIPEVIGENAHYSH